MLSIFSIMFYFIKIKLWDTKDEYFLASENISIIYCKI